MRGIEIPTTHCLWDRRLVKFLHPRNKKILHAGRHDADMGGFHNATIRNYANLHRKGDA